MISFNPDEFWSPYEVEITSFGDLSNIINGVFDKWKLKKRQFAWRGQLNAAWPLHSSLYRRLLWAKIMNQKPPEEKELRKEEHKILTELHRWGLHVNENGSRLAVLYQLAALQHYGAPTRLIDVTFNPWIAAWFAVQVSSEKESDCRLFAFDVTDRLINEKDIFRTWEDDFHRPWKEFDSIKHDMHYRWSTDVFAWKPPHFVNRIAAQNGAFIFGGVPETKKSKTNCFYIPKNPSNARDRWKIKEIRLATSIALRPHLYENKNHKPEAGAVYTFRIKASAKEDIRERLERNFGYSFSSIYPDYTGFAQFSVPHLPTNPPIK